MTNDITKIDNARALKAMGMPLNLPVEERTFAPKGTKLWVAVVKAGREFLGQTFKYGKDPSPRHYKAWQLAFRRLQRSAVALDGYITKLAATNEMEAIGLAAFLEPVAPFIEEYAEIFDALENGHEIELKLTVPSWME
jgi:hypothetical protein